MSLASSIPVLGLKNVCPRKGCPWPQIFLCPWPRALCPRLHLCEKHNESYLWSMTVVKNAALELLGLFERHTRAISALCGLKVWVGCQVMLYVNYW